MSFEGLKGRNLVALALLSVVIIATGYSYIAFGTGKLVVEITDPPENWGRASNIYIEYSEVEIHRAKAGNESGWFTVVDEGGWIDLSRVLNSSEALGTSSLRAGKYNLIRFQVLDAIVTVDGVNHTATVASGRLNIAITRGGVDIQVGQTSHVVIDVTPRVTGSQVGGFKLVPAAKATPIT